MFRVVFRKMQLSIFSGSLRRHFGTSKGTAIQTGPRFGWNSKTAGSTCQFPIMDVALIRKSRQRSAELGFTAWRNALRLLGGELEIQSQPMERTRIGINGRMLCRDSLEDLAVHPALNGARTVPAQNIHVVCLSEVGAEFFDLNRSSALSCAHKRWHISPKIATRGCLPLTTLAADEMSLPNTFKNRTGSGMPLTINVDSASVASSEMYLPCPIAAATSTPCASNLGRRSFRCDSVATTIAAFPVLRAAPTNRVTSSRRRVSSE